MRKNPWSSMIRGNPLLKLGLRSSSRMTRSMTGSKAATMLTAIACLPFGLVLATGLPFNANRSLLSAPFFVMVVIQYLIIPALYYNAIAGERERGSWDILRIAPVTTAQILVGKLASGFRLLLPVYVCLAVTVLIISMSVDWRVPEYDWGIAFTPMTALLGLAILMGQGIFVAGLTLLLSSRMKRSFSALMSTYGILLFVYVLLPFVFDLVDDSTQFLSSTYTILMPFQQLLANFAQTDISGGPGEAKSAYLAGYLGFYFLVGTLLLGWASITLDFADREMKFVQKNKV